MDGELPARFPYSVPSIRALFGRQMAFDAPVTYFVGENGSGKSTLLEGIAISAGSITVGSAPVSSDPTLSAARLFARDLRMTWSKRTRRGFYMRAEDFFGFAKAIDAARAEF